MNKVLLIAVMGATILASAVEIMQPITQAITARFQYVSAALRD